MQGEANVDRHSSAATGSSFVSKLARVNSKDHYEESEKSAGDGISTALIKTRRQGQPKFQTESTDGLSKW